MSTFRRLIPSLLFRKGRLVKGTRFSDHRDAGLPHTTARAHNAQMADELMLMDIDAAAEARGPDLETVEKVARECVMPLTVGGGIVSLDHAHRCMAAGADKICLTTAALDNPKLIESLAHTYGAQAVVLGLDVYTTDTGRWLYDHRTQKPVAGLDWLKWLRQAVSSGAGEVRLMAVDREGARQGMDTALFAEAAAETNVPIILEGGAGSLEHLDQAMREGVESVAVGHMLVFSDNNLIKIKTYLKNAGHPMRI